MHCINLDGKCDWTSKGVQTNWYISMLYFPNSSHATISLDSISICFADSADTFYAKPVGLQVISKRLKEDQIAIVIGSCQFHFTNNGIL